MRTSQTFRHRWFLEFDEPRRLGRPSYSFDASEAMGTLSTWPYTPLYEWAGGREAFDRMINAFYDRVERDDLLSPFFPGGVHEEHRRNVATWWCEVFGGPTDYTATSVATSGCCTNTYNSASPRSNGPGSPR